MVAKATNETVDSGMVPKPTKLVVCQTCGSTWFEKKTCMQFSAEVTLMAGQTPHDASPAMFLLACARCGELIEPPVETTGATAIDRVHDHFLDTVEGKFDKRPQAPKEQVKLGVADIIGEIL